MIDGDRQRMDQALAWLRRVHDPDFADWEGHAIWLEADARNLEAFDEVSLRFEEATAGLLPAPPFLPSNDNAPALAEVRRRRRPIAFGGAVAASLLALLAIPGLMHDRAQPLTIQTGPGEQRVIRLKDGTALALNGDTRVRIEGAHQRLAILDRGEIFFTVRHDAADPFMVEAGTAQFQDAGTAFDVVRTRGQTRLAVRQGEVIYNPRDTAVRLTAGQTIVIADGRATIGHGSAAQVGDWREGKLSYHAAPLGEVADDLSRAIGKPVTLDPDLANRRFTGVIVVSNDRARMFQAIASVLDVSARRQGGGWRIAKP